ncbi:hypothetical protein [Rosistilla oblonga]|uniref:hypothetical protein n=1 Tax=Rosistilla oblonga TaxID=2527990 RepID=UPI003A96FECC
MIGILIGLSGLIVCWACFPIIQKQKNFFVKAVLFVLMLLVAGAAAFVVAILVNMVG